MAKRIDDNPIIQDLIGQIFKNESMRSIRYSNSANELPLESPRLPASHNDSALARDITLFRDLDYLSQLISDILFLILNDPYYHCNHIYKFFNSHQLFQMMPLVQRFRNINKIHYQSLHEF